MELRYVCVQTAAVKKQTSKQFLNTVRELNIVRDPDPVYGNLGWAFKQPGMERYHPLGESMIRHGVQCVH